MSEHEFGGAGPDPSGLDVESARGFIASLLDLSFDTFVTPKVIQLVYVLCLAFAGLWMLLVIASAFSAGIGVGILMLMLSPLLYVICMLFIRMYLELVVVLFRIYETLQRRPA